MTTVTTTVAGVASTVGYSWRDDGQMTAITLDGVAVATLAYDPAGELAGVTYPFGGLGGLTKQPSGALVADTWTVNLANGASRTFTESLTRSQAGRVTASSWSDTGGSPVGWGYSYDQAGRLTQAVLAPAAGRAQTSFGYSFTPTGGCGADPQAGKNGSRTGSSIQTGAGTPQVTSYCYDQASRLTATTGANPIDPGTVSYDPHGNATRIGDQTWTYDAADQVTSTPVTHPVGSCNAKPPAPKPARHGTGSPVGMIPQTCCSMRLVNPWSGICRCLAGSCSPNPPPVPPRGGRYRTCTAIPAS